MPLVAAAVCPHPPLIVPELAGSAAPELDDLRAACDGAVNRLLAADPHLIIVVGGGPETIRYGPSDWGSMRPYGLDRRFDLRLDQRVDLGFDQRLDVRHDGRLEQVAEDGSSGQRLPLSVQIGIWLLSRSGTTCPRTAQGVATDEPAGACARLGARLVTVESRVALLVMGDGSACRGAKAPGYDDPRAQPYDDRVAAALGGADAEALLDLDVTLATELGVAGRAPWQVLGGAVRAAGGDWRGELNYYVAPYGVAYLAATWEPR